MIRQVLSNARCSEVPVLNCAGMMQNAATLMLLAGVVFFDIQMGH